MYSIFFFYISIFFISMLLCIPIGPINLEIFNNAMQRRLNHAVFIAIGAAAGEGIWATLAFFGISPFQKNIYLEGGFFCFTALITCGIGIMALKDSRFIEKKEDAILTKIKRKRWSMLKGLTLAMVNPLPVVSYMITLSFLRKSNLYIPMELNYEILFFLVVFFGCGAYFISLAFIASKMKKLINVDKTRKVVRGIGFLLLVLSLYFLYFAFKAFFYNQSIYEQIQ